jgi:DNA end-binding protein Ku
MARALWRGTISFGLVSIPVGLQAAVESRDALAFHLLHRKDGSRIDYKRFCAKEDVEVPWDEIVKGYEYGKGRYVALTDADFSAARVAATHTVAIRAFVEARDIDLLYFDHPYYLVPSGKGADKAYALLRDALEKAGRVGVGTIVLRQREHLVALEPVGSALALTTMRFADEIRAPASLRLGKGGGYTKQELALAGQLIEAMAAPWNPRDYRDTYTEALRRVIKQKLSGTALEVAPPPRPAAVVDLRAALEQSLKSPGKRAGDARRGMRPRARRRRAA